MAVRQDEGHVSSDVLATPRTFANTFQTSPSHTRPPTLALGEGTHSPS